MIRREIQENPTTVLENFDWVNDYQDTRAWLDREISFSGPIIHKLDQGHTRWAEKNWKQNAPLTAEETLLCTMTATLLPLPMPSRTNLEDVERVAEEILKSRLAKRSNSQ